MPNNSYLPRAEAAFETWLSTFNTVATQNKTVLKLSEEQLAALSNDLIALIRGTNDIKTAQNALKGLVTTRHNARKKAETDIRTAVRAIQGIPNLPPALKASLGISQQSYKPTYSEPQMPIGLKATPDAAGFNILDWKAGGNISGTIYLIEAQIGTYRRLRAD